MSSTESSTTSHERARETLLRFCCGEEVSAADLCNVLIYFKFDYGDNLLKGFADNEGKPLKKDSVVSQIKKALSGTAVKIERIAA